MAAKRSRVGDVELEWESHGEGGTPFVLVHGFTGARTDFGSHVQALAETRRVLAADHRGHGGSTNTGDPETYTLDTLTADLAAFLEEEARAPVDLLGHSMGGMIAVRLALAKPSLIRSLILMDTAAEPPGGRGQTTDFREMVETHGVRKVIEFAARSPERGMLAEAKGAEWVEADTEYRLSALDPEAFIALLPQVFRGEDLRPRLPEIRCPTTVLVGSLDAPFVPTSENLASGIPGARLEKIEGAYHSPQHTHPAEWRACVCAHLDRVDGVGT